MNDFISIVVPVYKAEAFISNLIDDVLAQTYQNWELILVSNGPNREKQEEICQRYALVDKRIKLLISNRPGTAIARNRGIEIAKGEWLTFLDDDDRIESTHLQRYIDAVENNVDMIIGGFTECFQDGKETLHSMEAHNSIIEGPAFYDYLLSCHTYLQGMVWNKLYKTESIQKSGIRLRENIRNIDDMVFNYELYLHHFSIKTIPITGYKYIRRYDSTLGRYAPSLDSSYRVFRNLYKEVCKLAGYPNNRIDQIIMKRKYTDTYIFIINLFRPNCSYTFAEKVKYVEKLLNDDEFIRSKVLQDKHTHKINLKIFRFLVMTRSPFCVSVFYTILFQMREIYFYLRHKILM